MNSQISKLRDAYYAGSPIASDGEYDKLELQLKALVKQYPAYEVVATALRTVGDTKNICGGRIKHARPMLSIENTVTEETFVAGAENYGDVVLEEPKRDGNSCELTFIDGKLVRAVTRGDGDAGEDMTLQVKACKKICQVLNIDIHDLRIRGELVMRKSELARINALGGKQYSNTRNLVSGTMKQQDLNIVASREILLNPWDMYSPDEDNLLPDSMFDRMKMTESWGFPKYEGIRVANDSGSSLIAALHQILKLNESSDIVADGVVIKADSVKLREKLGVKSNLTNWQHCYKPQNLAAETKLLDIVYQLGRLGKITPVAILEPVDLGGAMISRASCCNETWIENLGLMIGATVKVLRSGDVIPYITETVSTDGAKPIVFPTKCPSCGSKLKLDPDAAIVQRYCENSACPGRAAEQFAYVGKRETLEIDCLGDSMAEELVAQSITNIAGLFEFGNGYQILAPKKYDIAKMLKSQGFRSGANTVKMIKSLETAKSATWDRWIASLGIEKVGHSLGEDLSKALNLGPNDMAIFPAKLLSIQKIGMPGLGPKKMQCIIDWAKNPSNVDLCKRLAACGVKPSALQAVIVKNNAPLAGIAFCMTGELSIGTRKEIGAKLVALGGEELSGVKKNCNLLILGEKPGSKLQDAQKKGVKIVGEDWVRKQLGI